MDIPSAMPICSYGHITLLSARSAGSTESSPSIVRFERLRRSGSVVPSSGPSSVPSGAPSNFPSSIPSSGPSNGPSNVASAGPTILQSARRRIWRRSVQLLAQPRGTWMQASYGRVIDMDALKRGDAVGQSNVIVFGLRIAVLERSWTRTGCLASDG